MQDEKKVENIEKEGVKRVLPKVEEKVGLN
mgnify:CR=1 FL=1